MRPMNPAETLMPDHIATVVEKLGLSMDVERADANPSIPDMPEGSSHWICTLRSSDPDRATFQAFFSMGPALDHDPKIDEVLECVVSDVAGVRRSSSFDESAEDFGDGDMSVRGWKRLQRYSDTTRTANGARSALFRDRMDILTWGERTETTPNTRN